eukprot:3290348-Rhodomonas_salina.1
MRSTRRRRRYAYVLRVGVSVGIGSTRRRYAAGAYRNLWPQREHSLHAIEMRPPHPGHDRVTCT